MGRIGRQRQLEEEREAVAAFTSSSWSESDSFLEQEAA